MARNGNRALEIFVEAGGIIQNGHFVYASGKHGDVYVNKDAIYPYPHLVSELCHIIAKFHYDQRTSIDVVVGPATGGVLLSNWTAHHLSKLTRRSIVGVYADKVGDAFEIGRGYPVFVTGKNVLVVEDIFTTGGSAKKTVDAVHRIDGHVAAVHGLCNRGDVTAEQVGALHLDTLFSLPAKAYAEDECPMCAADLPINTEVGHGRKYLAERAQR